MLFLSLQIQFRIFLDPMTTRRISTSFFNIQNYFATQCYFSFQESIFQVRPGQLRADQIQVAGKCVKVRSVRNHEQDTFYDGLYLELWA